VRALAAALAVAVLGAAGGTARGTVQGVVEAGPTCPVERAGHPCSARPVVAAIEARDSRGRNAALTRSDRHGRFRLRLHAGTYALRVRTRALRRCPTTKVTVARHTVSKVRIHCDTGIR
jgi:hypothetical protein